MAVEADHAVAVHRQTEAGAPPEPLGVARHRLHLDAALDSCELAQELGNAGLLQAPLCTELHVLKVAATAATRSGVGTRRCHPVRRRPHNLDGVGPQVGARLGGDAGPYPLAREGMADEDDLPVGGPGHAPAATGDGTYLELQLQSPLQLCLPSLLRHAGEA